MISFVTVPNIPPTPSISVNRDSTITAELYPTNEQYGTIRYSIATGSDITHCEIEITVLILSYTLPISNYLLIAVPVFKPSGDHAIASYFLNVPLKELLSKALPSKTVSSNSQPLPFIVASFQQNHFPRNFHFGYEWRSAFKQKNYYCVVLVAFTKSDVSGFSLNHNIM